MTIMSLCAMYRLLYRRMYTISPLIPMHMCMLFQIQYNNGRLNVMEVRAEAFIVQPEQVRLASLKTSLQLL